MAFADSVKDLIKPPFANYDVVVYFGGGLFALPLINHYFVEPSSFRFPKFEFDIGFEFASYAVSLLSLLFAVYLLGHIIAYCGSLVIERTIDVFNGKVSSAIILSVYSNDDNREKIIASWVGKRFSKAFGPGRRIRNSLRLLIHVPMLPVYIIMELVGGLYYYRSRISRHILYLARMKLRAADMIR